MQREREGKCPNLIVFFRSDLKIDNGRWIISIYWFLLIEQYLLPLFFSIANRSIVLHVWTSKNPIRETRLSFNRIERGIFFLLHHHRSTIWIIARSTKASRSVIDENNLFVLKMANLFGVIVTVNLLWFSSQYCSLEKVLHIIILTSFLPGMMKYYHKTTGIETIIIRANERGTAKSGWERKNVMLGNDVCLCVIASTTRVALSFLFSQGISSLFCH